MKQHALKILKEENELGHQMPHPKLVFRKEATPLIYSENAPTRRFRGDLLIYFVALGIWAIATLWLVIRLVDKFF